MTDPIDFQILFNIAATLCSVLFGWILKTIWEAIKDLQQSDKQIITDLNGIQVLVAGRYVTRDENQVQFSRIEAHLDTISRKLDGKMDR